MSAASTLDRRFALRSATRCETLAHALVAMDKMHDEGDLDTAVYIAAVDSLRLVAARARLVNNLEHMVAKVNDPALPVDTRSHYLADLEEAAVHWGDVALRRLERCTWTDDPEPVR